MAAVYQVQRCFVKVLVQLYGGQPEALLLMYAKFYDGYTLAVTLVCMTCCCWLYTFNLLACCFEVSLEHSSELVI